MKRIHPLFIASLAVCSVLAALSYQDAEGQSLGRRAGARFLGASNSGGALQSVILDRILGERGELAAFLKSLDLTAEQKVKLLALRGSMKDDREALKASGEALRDAVTSDTAREDAIRAAADQLGQSISDAAVKASETLAKIRSILTAEQYTKVKEFMEERKTERQARREAIREKVEPLLDSLLAN
ncbi:MAG: hypothetical protein GC154_04845 [bacterium]|nr:hypothetical protein [bacterium]